MFLLLIGNNHAIRGGPLIWVATRKPFTNIKNPKYSFAMCAHPKKSEPSAKESNDTPLEMNVKKEVTYNQTLQNPRSFT